MNQEKDNKQLYQNTFNHIHAPEDLLGKVKNMNKQSKRKSFAWRKASAVAAVFAAVLVSSNAIAYAASGSTWIGKITVMINGEEKELDAEYEVFDDGTIEGEIIEIEVPEDENGEVPDSIVYSDSKDLESAEITNWIEQDGDKIYLVVSDMKIDVTEAFEDEDVSTGIFEMDGVTYQYRIKGGIDDYSLEITTP